MLCLLGPIAVLDGFQYHRLKLRPKALAVLVRVALEGPAPRADLADLVFPDAEDPRAALRWHLAFLREHHPEPLRTRFIVTPAEVALEAPAMSISFRATRTASLSVRTIQQPRRF